MLFLALIGVVFLLARPARVPLQAEPNPAGVTASLAVTSDGSLIKADSRGLFRSRDAGRTWEPMSLPRRLVPSAIGPIAVTPANPSVIYAAGIGAGVIVSEDRGATWRRITAGLPSLEVEALAIHAFRRETLFVSVRGKGIYRTEDGGRQWERMDGGPAGKSVLALAHSPLEGSMNTGWLYAGTADGPYLSMDCF